MLSTLVAPRSDPYRLVCISRSIRKDIHAGIGDRRTFGSSDPSLVAGTKLHRWYVANVLPGGEERAEWHLRRQGFAPFLPRQRRTIRHARRLVVRRAPFFPGYMFVSMDLAADRWRSVNGTFGVRSLIMQGRQPAPCPVGLVEQFVALTDADGLLDFHPALRTGSAVRVHSGPFAELVGVLEKIDSAHRARVLLKIMGGEIAVSMDVRDLVAV